MSEIVIDADFVQKVVQGSANIDRMRKEINILMGMVLEALPQKVRENSIFCCNTQRNSFARTWFIRTKFTEHESDFRDDYSGYKGVELWVCYQVIRNNREESVVFGHRLNADYPKLPIVPLEHVALLHADIHILLSRVIEQYPECTEFYRQLELLMAAA